MDDKRTCAECANFECQTFCWMGECKVDGSHAYYNDEACKDFVELQK
jgi:hypothetical protein